MPPDLFEQEPRINTKAKGVGEVDLPTMNSLGKAELSRLIATLTEQVHTVLRLVGAGATNSVSCTRAVSSFALLLMRSSLFEPDAECGCGPDGYVSRRGIG